MGFSYDYVRSESSADVERFAAIMTKNSYTEILVVGGDAALNYAVNGIMKAALPDGKCPALGIIPAGYSNDFAHYWGLYSKDYRKNIQALLENRKRSIDVGRCAIETKNGEQTEYFLNCVNVGAAASIMNLKHLTFSVFGLRTVSHFLSAFMLLFNDPLHRFGQRLWPNSECGALQRLARHKFGDNTQIHPTGSWNLSSAHGPFPES